MGEDISPTIFDYYSLPQYHYIINKEGAGWAPSLFI
jgi:hypothetical protein